MRRQYDVSSLHDERLHESSVGFPWVSVLGSRPPILAPDAPADRVLSNLNVQLACTSCAMRDEIRQGKLGCLSLARGFGCNTQHHGTPGDDTKMEFVRQRCRPSGRAHTKRKPLTGGRKYADAAEVRILADN